MSITGPEHDFWRYPQRTDDLPAGAGVAEQARARRAAGRTPGFGRADNRIEPAVSSQIARFSYNRSVEITNSFSGLKADVMWASTAAYTWVFLWPNNASRSKEFDALRGAGGYFHLRARHSGLCLALDARETSYRNGTPVVQTQCDENVQSSYWRLGTVGDRVRCDGDTCTTTSAVYPILENRYTGKCLDARNPSGGRPRVRALSSNGPASAPPTTGTPATSYLASAMR